MRLRFGEQGMLSYLIYKWGWWRAGLCTNPEFCSNQGPEFKQINWSNSGGSKLFLRARLWQFYLHPPKCHYNGCTGAIMWINMVGLHKQARKSHGPHAPSRSASPPCAGADGATQLARRPETPASKEHLDSLSFVTSTELLCGMLLLYPTCVSVSNIGPYAFSLFI